MTLQSTRRLALLAALPLLLTLACWDDDGTSPREYVPLACGTGTGATASSTIGPEGGTVSVGGNTLIVPPNALSSPVTFRLTERQDRYVGMEVLPHGTQFARNATLSLSYARCGNPGGYRNFRVLEVDSSAKVLRSLPSQVDSATRTVRTTRLDHLSGYLIGTNRSEE